MRCRCRLLTVKHTKAQVTTAPQWVWPMLWCLEVWVAWWCLSINRHCEWEYAHYTFQVKVGRFFWPSEPIHRSCWTRHSINGFLGFLFFELCCTELLQMTGFITAFVLGFKTQWLIMACAPCELLCELLCESRISQRAHFFPSRCHHAPK